MIQLAEEFKWFLKDAIVDTGMCTYCGACAAVCPYDIIEFDENGPKLKRNATETEKVHARMCASGS
jgi:ferredoxin